MHIASKPYGLWTSPSPAHPAPPPSSHHWGVQRPTLLRTPPRPMRHWPEYAGLAPVRQGQVAKSYTPCLVPGPTTLAGLPHRERIALVPLHNPNHVSETLRSTIGEWRGHTQKSRTEQPGMGSATPCDGDGGQPEPQNVCLPLPTRSAVPCGWGCAEV